MKTKKAVKAADAGAEFPLKVEKGASGRWVYDTGRNHMEASCHHATGLNHYACGGCYARAVEVLSRLAEQDEPLAVAFIAAVKAEGANVD